MMKLREWIRKKLADQLWDDDLSEEYPWEETIAVLEDRGFERFNPGRFMNGWPGTRGEEFVVVVPDDHKMSEHPVLVFFGQGELYSNMNAEVCVDEHE